MVVELSETLSYLASQDCFLAEDEAEGCGVTIATLLSNGNGKDGNQDIVRFIAQSVKTVPAIKKMFGRPADEDYVSRTM